MQIWLVLCLQKIIKQSLVNFIIYKKKVLLIYWAILTFILLKPGSDHPHQYWFYFNGIDKLVHFSIFALLVFLLRLVYHQWSISKVLCVILFYGIFTELAQHYMQMGRSGDVLDLLADMLGATIGLFVYQLLRRFC